jgi:hypothetical protein
MSELITENQVKIRYMKVIGRLHPDKVRKASIFILFAQRVLNPTYLVLA